MSIGPSPPPSSGVAAGFAAAASLAGAPSCFGGTRFAITLSIKAISRRVLQIPVMRERMLWIGIGVLSLLLAAALGLATSRLTEAPVGLSAEPVSAGEALAPTATATPTRTPEPTPKPKRKKRTPERTATPEPTPTAAPTAAPTAVPTVDDDSSGSGSSGDDDSDDDDRGRGRGRGRGRSGDDD